MSSNGDVEDLTEKLDGAHIGGDKDKCENSLKHRVWVFGLKITTYA